MFDFLKCLFTPKGESQAPKVSRLQPVEQPAKRQYKRRARTNVQTAPADHMIISEFLVNIGAKCSGRAAGGFGRIVSRVSRELKIVSSSMMDSTGQMRPGYPHSLLLTIWNQGSSAAAQSHAEQCRSECKSLVS